MSNISRIGILIISLIVVFLSFNVFADGFICVSKDDHFVAIQIYNSTDQSVGTRVAHAIIISDPSKSYGQRTIARFIRNESSLSNYGTLYYMIPYQDCLSNVIKCDNELFGHKLKDIGSLVIGVDFKYSSPVENETMLNGKMIMNVYTEKVVPYEYELSCKRYLKN